jgi:hypothetical protein
VLNQELGQTARGGNAQVLVRMYEARMVSAYVGVVCMVACESLARMWQLEDCLSLSLPSLNRSLPHDPDPTLSTNHLIGMSLGTQ